MYIKGNFLSSPMSSSSLSLNKFFSELFVVCIYWVAFILNNLHSFPLLWEKLLVLHFGIVFYHIFV